MNGAPRAPSSGARHSKRRQPFSRDMSFERSEKRMERETGLSTPITQSPRRVDLSARITAHWRADVEHVPRTTDGKSPGKKMTPTDRLSGFGTSLATNSDSGERVPRGHH